MNDFFEGSRLDNVRNYLRAQFLNTGDKDYWRAYHFLSHPETWHRFTPVTNTSVDLRKRLRNRHCGRWTLNGVSVERNENKYLRLNCNCWDCDYCAPRKAARYKYSIRREAERLGLRRFLTLTLDPKIAPADSVRYLKACWAKLRVALQRRYGVAPTYICVMEFQKKTKMPHLHVLIDRYVDQAWVKDRWEEVGGGSHVDIRAVDIHRVSRYLSKYLTKELLMSAPKRSRRITVSKAVTLNEKTEKTHTWRILSGSIFRYFARALNPFGMQWGPDAVLQSFSEALSPI